MGWVLAQEAAPPAGGTAIGEVVAASAVALLAVVAVVALGVSHRRRGTLDPLVRVTEQRTGLPAWSVLPVAIAGISLIVAVWGYYWDVSIHIDQGRDPGPFANPAHWFIIAGLDGIAFAGLLALVLGDDRSASAVRLRDGWSVPVGGILLAVCGVVALAGFPLDDLWHRLFGQDVTAWGPTHVQMIGGASLATIACWVLVVEGQRAADAPTRDGRAFLRFADIALAGAFLVGLSTLQVEFDYGVPQFRLLEHPVLIAAAGSIALVTARLRVGRGGALAAAGAFLLLRVALAVGVSAFDRVDLHVALYLGPALLVEVVAAVLGTERLLRFGVVSGVAIGTVGLATEWAWSRIQAPIGWSSDLFPEVVPFVLAAAVGGGLLGALAGRDLAGLEAPTPWWALALGWVGVVGAIGLALPMTADAARTVDVTVEPDGNLAVTVDPPSAAEDAAWFHVLTWQAAADGEPGGSSLTELEQQDQGTWRTTEPVILDGSAKTILRLQRGTSLQSAGIYLPEDEAIPAPAEPAVSGERELVADKLVLQREARTDRAGLERVAYAVLALIAAAWLATITWGLQRLGRYRFSNSIPASTESQVAAVTPSSRSSRLSTRPTGLRGSSARNSM